MTRALSPAFLLSTALALVLSTAVFAADPAPTADKTLPAAADTKPAETKPADAKPADTAATPAAEIKAPPANSNAAGSANSNAAGSAAAPTARHWDVVADKSSIAFHGKQMGTDFDGVFKSFKADIHFDPADLEHSGADVTVDVASIDARDAERNKNVQGKDWFDTAQFPTARFVTTKIAKTGDNAYTADANLTIHGVTVPAQLPFTLAISPGDSGKDQAVMTGKLTLDRSKFQLGQGDWADPTVIANEVPVEVKVTATAPKQKDAPKDGKAK